MNQLNDCDMVKLKYYGMGKLKYYGLGKLKQYFMGKLKQYVTGKPKYVPRLEYIMHDPKGINI